MIHTNASINHCYIHAHILAIVHPSDADLLATKTVVVRIPIYHLIIKQKLRYGHYGVRICTCNSASAKSRSIVGDVPSEYSLIGRKR